MENNRLRRKRTPLGLLLAFGIGVVFLAFGAVALWIVDLIFRPIQENFKQIFRAYISKMPDNYREYFRFFDSYGLRFSTRHLNSLSWRDMTAWELNALAEYADINTVHMAKQRRIGGWHVHVDDNHDWQTAVQHAWDHNNVNPTMVGNMAYIALHDKEDKIREQAFNQLCWLREKCGHPPMNL